jgi:formate-dependent nitrite reductase membrane component NrfD
MAMFGFVYAWYLVVVLLLEVWFDYRHEIVIWSRETRGPLRYFYKLLTLGATDISEAALRFDDRAGRLITIIGIPSAFLLHGYVGFIFGSVKANPWWSSVLMPVVFLFSAIVSGMAMVMLIYMVTSWIRWKPIDMACLNKLGEFVLYALIVDFALEFLDFIHRLYESEESIHILSQLITDVLQVLIGGLVPLIGLVAARFGRLPDEMRRMIYFLVAILIQVGIFSMRWNVVVGGQMFSKSLRGLTVYKVHLFGLEGLFFSMALLLLPVVILYVLMKLLPPWIDAHPGRTVPAPVQ